MLGDSSTATAVLPDARVLLMQTPSRRGVCSCVQCVPRLCASLPVVIDGETWEEPAEALDDLFLGDAEIW